MQRTLKMRATFTSNICLTYQRGVTNPPFFFTLVVVLTCVVVSLFINAFSLFLDWDVTGADQSIQGFTHQSHIINSKSHFGHSFTLDISKPYRADSEEIPLSSPLLLFEVYNVGFWNRQSSVGYGFTRLRLDPGSHVEMVPTWRPMRDSPGEKLEEFFLGLAPEIENLSYAGIPNDVGLNVKDYPS